jgi:O-antigen/teichoic acid export membrane protein
MAILIVPTTLYLVQAGSTKVLYGMARHRALAGILLVEGIANLLLSVPLAKYYGINGVAVGTAIPLACTSLLFLPMYLCRVLGLNLWPYLRSAYAWPVVVSIPLALTVSICDHLIQPQDYANLLLVLVIGALVYIPGVIIYFLRIERSERIPGSERMCTPETASKS